MAMRAPLLMAFVALAACSATPDEFARDAAKQAIRPVLADNPIPGVPLEPAADCIIDNATSPELLSLATDAVTGPTASTAEVIARVVARQPTQICLGQSYITALGGGIF